MKINQVSKLNNQIKSRTAFSLIELSIVILIIGILVTAVTSSSALLSKASLTTARKYTGDSSIRYSQGLIAWYDATTEIAFGSTTATLASRTPLTTTSGSPNVPFDDVYGGYDANIQTTASNNVIYTKSNLSGLPAVTFSSTGTPPGNSLVTTSSFPAVSANETTIFIVARWAPLVNSVILEKTSDFSIKQDGTTAGNVKISISNSSSVYDVSTDLKVDNSVTVMSFAFSKSDNKLYVYKNGAITTKAGTTVAPGTAPSAGTLYIGSGAAAGTMSNADIGEVIILNRKLSDAERKEIEAYLGAKWKVKVS